MEIDSDFTVAVYDLYAIIIHAGTGVNSGHYYTIANDSTNGWNIFNDS